METKTIAFSTPALSGTHAIGLFCREKEIQRPRAFQQWVNYIRSNKRRKFNFFEYLLCAQHCAKHFIFNLI